VFETSIQAERKRLRNIRLVLKKKGMQNEGSEGKNVGKRGSNFPSSLPDRKRIYGTTYRTIQEGELGGVRSHLEGATEAAVLRKKKEGSVKQAKN